MVYKNKTNTMVNFVATACLLTLSLLCSVAQASDKELARTKFREGVELFANEEYPAALTIFEESYAIRKSNTVLYNIAMCQRALFMHVEAVRSFTEYMSGAGDKISAAEKAEINSWIDEMKKKVARLQILGAPKGSSVFIDGDAAATTPLIHPLLLNQGNHAVEVRRDGYLPFAADVKALMGAEISLKITLKTVDTPGNAQPTSHMPPQDQVTKESSPPTAPAIVSTQTTDGKNLKIMGIVLMGLGVATGTIGGIFTYKYVDDKSVADGARDRYNAADNPSPADKKAYYDAKDKLSPDKAGIALGYIGAGVLLTTGLILTGVGNRKNKTTETSLAPTPGGLRITF